jgi:hypothetical protein
MINSLAMVIEQCTAESGFSTFSARDLVLLRSELLTPFFVRFLNSGYRNGSGEFPIGTDQSYRHVLSRRWLRIWSSSASLVVMTGQKIPKSGSPLTLLKNRG